MSDQAESAQKGIEWKWERFATYGEKLPYMPRQDRVIFANIALGLAEDLSKSSYIRETEERLQDFEKYYARVTENLDEDTDAIQSAVATYFYAEHHKAGLKDGKFDIQFYSKSDGAQTGLICHILNGEQICRYFIKTHQHGPTKNNPISLQPPDVKEAFIYKLLYRIGSGPEVHFIVPVHDTRRTVYIATKDCHLVLLSNLTHETVNFKALLQLDLISRILCLRDCASNPFNCGQVGDKPMIVDFRVDSQPTGYLKSDILDRFYKGNGEFNYVGLMGTAVKTSNQEKLNIVKESLEEWKLLKSIEEGAAEVNEWIQEVRGKIGFENDLDQYARDIKATVNLLYKACDMDGRP